jgi:hypothetical protein
MSFAMQKGTLVNLVSYYYWMLVTGIGQARAETLHGGKEESVRQDQQDLHEALLLFRMKSRRSISAHNGI